MPKKQKKSKKHLLVIKKLHLARAAWCLVLVFGLLGINFVYQFKSTSDDGKVLAYATKISHNDLLNETNKLRAENGLSPLTLNDQLNIGANLKASDMISKNYWGHTSPEGTEPWVLFNLVGYKYLHAGENLAYGFRTSQEVVSGWMNSKSHRDNLLGDYKEIGFGFLNSADFQGGQNTIVVALLGKPSNSPTPTTAGVVSGAQSDQSKKVSNISALLNGTGNWALVASLGLVASVTAGASSLHLKSLQFTWRRSKKFVLLHPILDAIVILSALFVLLNSAIGFVK